MEHIILLHSLLFSVIRVYLLIYLMNFIFILFWLNYYYINIDSNYCIFIYLFIYIFILYILFEEERIAAYSPSLLLREKYNKIIIIK